MDLKKENFAPRCCCQGNLRLPKDIERVSGGIEDTLH